MCYSLPLFAVGSMDGPDESTQGEQRIVAPIPGITERERRFAIAYVGASLDLARDDDDVMELAYYRAFPMAPVDSKAVYRVTRDLVKRRVVRDFIMLLRREMSIKAILPAARVVQELERMAMINILDLGRVDENGQFHVDLSRADHVVMSGVHEIEATERVLETRTSVDSKGIRTTSSVLSRTTKIKLKKADALAKLAQIHGLDRDPHLDDRLLEMVGGR